MRRILAWLLGRRGPTRLEALRLIVQMDVIAPSKPAKPHMNLLVYRSRCEARRKVA